MMIYDFKPLCCSRDSYQPSAREKGFTQVIDMAGELSFICQCFSLFSDKL